MLVTVSTSSDGSGWSVTDLDEDLLPDVEERCQINGHVTVEDPPENLPAAILHILDDPADIAIVDRSERLFALVVACPGVPPSPKARSSVCACGGNPDCTPIRPAPRRTDWTMPRQDPSCSAGNQRRQPQFLTDRSDPLPDEPKTELGYAHRLIPSTATGSATCRPGAAGWSGTASGGRTTPPARRPRWQKIIARRLTTDALAIEDQASGRRHCSSPERASRRPA